MNMQVVDVLAIACYECACNEHDMDGYVCSENVTNTCNEHVVNVFAMSSMFRMCLQDVINVCN